MHPIKRDIVDNITDDITMSAVLNSEIPHTKGLDISTGYFDIAGYSLLRQSLEVVSQRDTFAMRLILGRQAILPDINTTFEEDARRYNEDVLSIKSRLDDEHLSTELMSDTTSLIAFLKRKTVQVRLGPSRFNHAKCYITDGSALVGSSNLTKGGLKGNYELNAALYQPLAVQAASAWFESMWQKSDDTKEVLVKILEESKFGIPATPYEVYIKMLFEKYHDHLTSDKDSPQYHVTLTQFQKDAVRTAMFIISDYGGAMVADATGLGKTNIGMEVLRQKILKDDRKVLLIAPSQVLKTMWENKLREAGLSVRKQITMESLGRDTALEALYQYNNIDFVLIDESQNFRSSNAKRSQNLAKIMTVGTRKQVLLLSATPINNSIMDLYNQLCIITRKDPAYFYRTIGIPDLYRHMRDAANKEGGLEAGLEKIERLLDSVMVRRTRSYIREVYPNDKIDGRPIKFPKHEYSTVRYSLTELYGNIFQKLLDDINRLTMAPYGLKQYDRKAPEEEKAKHKVLAHLQVILLLKRFESSVEAVKTSLDNKIRLYKCIDRVLDQGRMLRVKDFNRIITKWNNKDIDPDGDDDSEEEDHFIREIESLKLDTISVDYDAKGFQQDLRYDLEILENLRKEVGKVTVDKKLERVRDTIISDNAFQSDGKKVLIFTEYTTTATYVLKKLRGMFDGQTIECITGRTKPETRARYIERFAPKSNLADDRRLEGEEIDILISTDVLAEGQNLQDCNYVINYDLPWNPMRIVQRIGRVDRLTSGYDVIRSRACYPDTDLDAILKLVGKLLDKIGTVDKVIGLDSELLGQTPTPKQYNGSLKERLEILGKGGKVAAELMEQMGRSFDLMPHDTPLNEIARRAKEIGIEHLASMQMGRRSGLEGNEKKCVLAYVREKPERRVYFVIYDYGEDQASVPDNDYDAVKMIKCRSAVPAYLPMDGRDHLESFKELVRIDEKARAAIRDSDDVIRQQVQSVRNTSYDKIQNEITEIIMDAVNGGELDTEKTGAIEDVLNARDLRAWESDLKEMILQYREDRNIDLLVKRLGTIGRNIGVGRKPKDQETEIDYSEMKLVGAIFITPPTDVEESQAKLTDHI